MIGSIVNTTALGKVVLYSLVAGVGIAGVFGVGVTSAAGLLEAWREGRAAASVAWALAAVVCLICAIAATVLGVVVMAEKG